MKKPTKAIIAAAGFGTRFLPQTKAMPKEMLPLIDKPIIQYVVDELVQAGITDIIIIGSSNKRAIEDHFDLPSSDLVKNLEAGGEKKRHYLDQVNKISEMANFIYLRQKGPYGNATPIACAKHLIGDEPFIYTYADDFFSGSESYGRTKQMIETYEKTGGSVLACKKIVDDAEYDRYGVVAGDKTDEESVLRAKCIVEKPGKKDAPSSLASVSGYLFTPDIFKYLDEAQESFDNNGELMVQPVMQNMINDGYEFFAREIVDAKYYDTGDKLEYLKTTVDFALKNEKFGKKFAEFLKSRV